MGRTREWFFDNVVTVMKQPAKSSEFNITENAWKRLVRKYIKYIVNLIICTIFVRQL